MVSGGRVPPRGGALPSRVTRFVGRDDEATTLVELLEGERLVTLVGAPGCGKTRLAIELAERVARRFDGQVRFVDLAPVGDPTSVVNVVGDALEVTEQPGRQMDDVLVEVLAELEPMLLVLDNCEHVVDTVAALVHRFATTAPSLSVLATSRTAVGVHGERVWPVPPLNVPAAVELFTDRAAMAGSSPLMAADESVLAKICTLLGCLPLAIELTAAWARVLSPRQVLDRLISTSPESPKTPEPTDAHDAGSRHDTMAAAVGWSYQRLPPGAQRLFRQMSPFAGSFDLDALEAVADADVLDELMMLVDNSLVLTERDASGDGPMRYRLLEPVRQFAASLLTIRDEADDVRARHFEHFRSLATRCDPWEPPTTEWISIDRLALDDGNLLAAWDWARQQPGDLARRLCAAAYRYWGYGGRVNDGLHWIETALAEPTDDRRLQAEGLAGGGLLAWRRGNYDLACDRLDRALEMASTLDDHDLFGRSLLQRATVDLSTGQFDEGAARCLHAIEHYEAAGALSGFARERAAVRVATALLLLGWTSYVKGDCPEGDGHMHRALETNLAVDNPSVSGHAHLGLAYNALHGDDAEAQRFHLTAVADAIDRGGVVEKSDWLWLSAAAAALQSRFNTAMRLIGGAEAWGRRRGSEPPVRFAGAVATRFDETRDRVAPALTERLLDRGRRMSWSELVADALADPVSQQLTRRELEIARLVAEGLTNKDIADRLTISSRTVETHIEHVRQKLGFRSRTEIVAWMLQDPTFA